MHGTNVNSIIIIIIVVVVVVTLIQGLPTRETLHTEVAVKIKTHSLFSVNLYRKPTSLVV